jgi:hypothetical protein
VSVDERDQGRIMGNNQALQVGAESLSGITMPAGAWSW